MTDPRNLLARVIAASGLSARAFARTVLIRDERTIRRWLAGDSPIPKSVRDFLNIGMERGEWCAYCDGCGWTEGGATLQTTCSKCNGSGRTPVLDFLNR